MQFNGIAYNKPNISALREVSNLSHDNDQKSGALKKRVITNSELASVIASNNFTNILSSRSSSLSLPTQPQIQSNLPVDSIENVSNEEEIAQDVITMLYKREKDVYNSITDPSTNGTCSLYVVNYLEFQPDINEKKRLILIDWLVDVALRFKLTPESFYLAINIIDRYFSKMKIPLNHVQLVGIVSLCIAAKYEEIYPPSINDCIHIAANTYSKSDFIRTERQISATLQYKFTVPTVYPFLLGIFEFIKKLNISTESMVLLRNASLMFLEYAVQNYKHLAYYPSELAHASYILATLLLTTNNVKLPKDCYHSAILEEITGHTLNDLLPCIQNLIQFVHAVLSTKYTCYTP